MDLFVLNQHKISFQSQIKEDEAEITEISKIYSTPVSCVELIWMIRNITPISGSIVNIIYHYLKSEPIVQLHPQFSKNKYLSNKKVLKFAHNKFLKTFLFKCYQPKNGFVFTKSFFRSM